MSDIEKHNAEHGLLPNGAPAPRFRTFANPAPLGLMSFASTTLILSLVNAGSSGVHTPNVVVGMALFVGGLCQLLAGMWEFACGNTLGATAFSSYGGFWLSFATIFIPGSGVLEAYTGPTEGQLPHALGFYLAAWFIFTFLMLIAALRTSVGLVSLFFFLTMTFLMLMLSDFVSAHTESLTKAGGILGIITAFIAYYVGISNMLTHEHFFQLPVAPIAKRD